MKNFILSAVVLLSCFVFAPSTASAQKAGWQDFIALFPVVKTPYQCCTDFPVAASGTVSNFKSIPDKLLSVDGIFNEPSGKAWAVGKFKVSPTVVATIVYTDNSDAQGENRSYRLFTFNSTTGQFLNACQIAAKMTTLDGGTLMGKIDASSTIGGDFKITCNYSAMKKGNNVSQVIKMEIKPDGNIVTLN